MSQTFVLARNAPAAEYDRSLAWAALLLAASGLVMVYSASIATAEANRYTGNNAAWFLARHALFLGLFALAVNSEFHYNRYFSMLPSGPDPKHAGWNLFAYQTQISLQAKRSTNTPDGTPTATVAGQLFSTRCFVPSARPALRWQVDVRGTQVVFERARQS